MICYAICFHFNYFILTEQSDPFAPFFWLNKFNKKNIILKQRLEFCHLYKISPTSTDETKKKEILNSPKEYHIFMTITNKPLLMRLLKKILVTKFPTAKKHSHKWYTIWYAFQFKSNILYFALKHIMKWLNLFVLNWFLCN